MEPLPPPLVDPGIAANVLISEAEARGTADGLRHERNSWSFGGPADPVSEGFDPSYVVSLRRRCDSAVRTARMRYGQTLSRTAPLRTRRDEANRFMSSARSMMDGLAVRSAQLREPDLDQSGAPDPAAPSEVDENDAVWEGETTTLGLAWRLLVLAGLIAVDVFLNHYALQSLMTDPTAAWAVSGAAAVILVAAPHLTALLLRARQATGTERRLMAAVAVLAGGWVVLVGLLAVVCGAVLNRRSLEPLHLTPITVVLMFVGFLVVVGAMSFMLGLSRRHPFQEAYARHRRLRDEAEAERQAVIERINPALAEPQPDEDDGVSPLDHQVLAVRAAYAAAEEAYFAALISAVADPSFTEAVQHRRGLRTGVQQ